MEILEWRWWCGGSDSSSAAPRLERTHFEKAVSGAPSEVVIKRSEVSAVRR